MNQDEYKILSEQVSSVQKSVDIIDKDLGKDRQDIQQLVIRVSTLEAQIDEMRKLIDRIPQKTQDKMAEVAQPIIAEAQDLKEVIEDKKMVAINTQKIEEQKKQKKPFWKFWRR